MEAKFGNCEGVQEGLMDLLANELSAQEQQAMHAHLAHCPACQHELQAVQKLWHTMGNLPVPEPSEQLRPRFYSMLAEFQADEQRKQRWSLAGMLQQLQDWWQPEYATRLAYSLVLLVVGLAAGYLLRGRETAAPADSQQPMAVVEAPDGNVQQAQMLTLLANPSAVQRLRAVSYAEELAPSNDRVVAALLSTLNQDPNVNVRLASLEVLAGLSQDPTVRQGLVRSLARQESPLVQSAMADVMVQLQERRSVRPLRKLLQQENLNEQVKTKIEQSIQSLSTERSADHSTPSTYDETLHHIRTDLDTSVAA
ncbi:HEAT repeat domain-containing protein [Hymenobacter sp. DG25B]|uniref:HEAT repeat domain-containing protein n=1 Tax=Hymenobacter sp. DG25B TaxID=1385664 RepID=UPI0006627C47|nr:HEAT repeat domain-containing protein [Hymenobacter sp. DG25B]